ncbi:MAG: diguanylate cyclase [Candidatus Thiodiazotropha sp.]
MNKQGEPEKLNEAQHNSIDFSTRKTWLISFLSLFVPVFVLLAGSVLVVYNQAKEYEFQLALKNDESALNVANETTSLMFVPVISDLLVLVGGESLNQFLHDRSELKRERVAREFSLFARLKPKLTQIRVLDLDGRELVRVNQRSGMIDLVPQERLQDKSDRYYFRQALQLGAGEIYMSPMDLNLENGVIELPVSPMVRFAVPVVSDAGENLGVVVINYAAKGFLERIDNVFGEMKGQAVLLDTNGYWLTGVPEEQRWGFMYGHRDTFASRWPEAWSAIEKADKGVFRSSSGLFLFQKSYPVLLLPQASGGSSVPDDLAGMDRLKRLHWILVSYIADEKIDQLTATRFQSVGKAYALLVVFVGVVSMFFARNAGEKKRAVFRLQQLAVTDALTGVANRREFDMVSEQEFSRAQRYTRDLAILLIDLDHFKSINDTHGHAVGDEVLKYVVKVFRKVIRTQDVLARYGGEEFAVILPETHSDGALQMGGRVCQRVSSSPYEGDGVRITITVSIGVSSMGPGDVQVRDILRRADEALYDAKGRGRNQVVVVSP